MADRTAHADLTSVAIELLAITDPQHIRARLVRLGLDVTQADRCTLTSIDRGVIKVEDSIERDGRRPPFVGQEYPLDHLEGQTTLQRAIAGEVITGGGFSTYGRTSSEVAASVEEMRHTAIVPLKLGTDVGAVFILSRRRDQPFDVGDLERLRQVGGMAVLSLRNARLLEGVTAAQRRGLDALTLISEAFAVSEQLPAFFGRMGETVAGLAGAKRVAYWIVSGDELVAQAETYGFSLSEERSMRVSLADVLRAGLGPILYGGQSLTYQRAESPDGDGMPIAPVHIENLLAVPWRTSEGPLGLLVAYDSVSEFAAQDEWITRLSARASALVYQSYTAQRRLLDVQQHELERLQAHADRMAAVDHQKSDFLKLASHELRGPITIMRGYLSMITDGTIGARQGDMRAAVEKMEDQVVHMKELVDQMLAAARLEDSRLAVTLYDTRIDDVVREVISGLDARSAQRVALHDAQPARAFADRRHVATIVGNLISNGIKYSPNGGSVDLSLRERGDVVELDVRDHGIGIVPDNLSRLFQPFSRLADAESLGVDGVGLGLYLSRELARAQGGDILVRSAPGAGTTFTLRLPRWRHDAALTAH